MRLRSVVPPVIVALLVPLIWPMSAVAADDSSSTVGTGSSAPWSVISAEPDQPGSNVFSMEMGFPGFTFGWEHGVSPGFDAGVKLDLDYGLFNTTQATLFSLGFRVPLRVKVFQQDMVSLALHFDPGLFVYPEGNALFGFEMTPGANLGFQVLPKLRLGIGADLPMSLNVVNGTFFVVGPLFGGSIEYLAMPRLQIGLNLRFGPTWFVSGPYQSSAVLGLVTQMTVGILL